VLVQEPVLADAVEVQVHRQTGKADLSLQLIMKPVAHIRDQEPPRAILGAESAGERDVGMPETRPRLAQRLADEHQPRGRAVPDRRFRDRKGDREKTKCLVEEAAHIEPVVVF
jgi:hypothetical protein